MDFCVDIEKRFPGFSLNVKFAGGRELIGILGASGSGKSMTLRCIAGLVKPDRGKIVINGRTLFDSEKKVNVNPKKRNVGFLFQNYALFPHLTVWQNIAFGLFKLPDARKKSIVADLIDKFHLNGLANRYPAQVSGGQQQRIALARALAAQPEILLLDEPFSALDGHLRMKMIKEMREYLHEYSGSTLLVTHNIEEAYRLCGSLAVLSHGEVHAFGPKEQIFERPATSDTARLTGCKNIFRVSKKAGNIFAVPDWKKDLVIHTDGAVIGGWAGIRERHIKLYEDGPCENVFPAWTAGYSELPFSNTVFLKIGEKPLSRGDYHLEWEVSRDYWRSIEQISEPLKICLPPEKIFFMPQ